jgi:hypothetical protein
MLVHVLKTIVALLFICIKFDIIANSKLGFWQALLLYFSSDSFTFTLQQCTEGKGKD